MTGLADWPAETLADMLIRAVEHDPQAFTDPERLRSAFAVIYPTLGGAQLEALLLPVRLAIPAQLERGESVTAASAGLQSQGWDPATAGRYTTAYALALGLPVATSTYSNTEPATQWTNQPPPLPGAGQTATAAAQGPQYPPPSQNPPAVSSRTRPNRFYWISAVAVVVVAAGILIPVLLSGSKGHVPPPPPTSTHTTGPPSSSSPAPVTVSCVNSCTASQASLAEHLPNMVTSCEPPVDDPSIVTNTGATAGVECQVDLSVAQSGDSSPTALFAIQYPNSAVVPTSFLGQVACSSGASATPTQWFLNSDTNDAHPIGVEGCLDFLTANWVVWTYTQPALEIIASGSGLSGSALDTWFSDLADESLTVR